MNEITDLELIREMAGGSFISVKDLGGWDGYEYELRRAGKLITSSQLNRLIDAGWLRSSNTAYFLTDEGMKSFLRSTDEIGDGRLVAPQGGRVNG